MQACGRGDVQSRDRNATDGCLGLSWPLWDHAAAVSWLFLFAESWWWSAQYTWPFRLPWVRVAVGRPVAVQPFGVVGGKSKRKRFDPRLPVADGFFGYPSTILSGVEGSGRACWCGPASLWGMADGDDSGVCPDLCRPSHFPCHGCTTQSRPLAWSGGRPWVRAHRRRTAARDNP